MAGFYSLMVVSMRKPVWERRYPNHRGNRELKYLSSLSHTGLLASAASALHYVWANSFLWMESSLPPSLPRPPVMSTGRDFTLKRDSSGNEENVEFGWKIPTGFWVKWFLSFCLVGKVTSPTAPLKLRGSPCWGHVRQPAATGAAEKPSRAWNVVHYQPRWTSWAIGCADSSRWDEQQALCHG